MDTLRLLLVGVCIGIACAIVVPGQPRSVILTIVLIVLWHLTFNHKIVTMKDDNTSRIDKIESALASIFKVCNTNADLEAEKRKAEQDALLASIPEEKRPANRENW